MLGDLREEALEQSSPLRIEHRAAEVSLGYTTLLRQNNGDPKVVQGLLRHNSIKVTMDIYDEAMSDEKQMAHRKVLRLVTRKQEHTVMRTASGTGVPAST